MKPQPAPAKPYSVNEVVRLVWIAIFIAVFSFLFYFRAGDILLYGDAVAHINIARRVFDSRTPGLLQLGTVWLPLPHLLILPFVASKQLWQNGAGGSIPSMAGFVFATLGIFRLVRTLLSAPAKNGAEAGAEVDLKVSAEAKEIPLILPWLATVLYAANPNLIYMQSTAMGESLYLAFFIWAVLYFVEFARGNAKSLVKSGYCLLAACLTRYDGWFLAAILIAGFIGVLFLRRGQASSNAPKKKKADPATLSRGMIAKFLLFAIAGPALWLAYNAAVYKNPLEFANGPYSAKAIEQRTETVNPAKGNVVAAGSYFLKAVELNTGGSNWVGRLWLALALLGSLAALFTGRARAALLLWTPLLFYALSIAYGGVPIFVPTWWPFSQYNVRYGLQLLPAFAVFVPLGIYFLVECAAKIPQIQPRLQKWASTVTASFILIFCAASYAAIWRAEPICHQEASINMRGRASLDRQLGDWLKFLPPTSTLLMYLGEHPGALERDGIPLRRTINEGNHRVWKRPSDPDGLWERALANPAAYADFAIGFEGDPVWNAARDHQLAALVELHTTGQPPAIIFQARPPASSPANPR
jgi:hypothetical protein